jgi:hypothetical protein
METNGRFGGIVGIGHEIADGVENERKALVMVGELLFKGFEFSAEVFMGGEELAQVDKGADDFDANAHGGGAAKDCREHGHAIGWQK